ncbi:hypothetical protein [Acinetobacter rudis]|uniref:Uncharacterized protein n=1 Tax=Acinetobacter rudis TaxID=632955 RepID=A0AAW8J4Z8_9GAMM|nr:hypothetical protein [Acinetobacter rudis]MDQ8934256.1 hypothetical protein [Acinetobacter rudis]MDQ8952587.1 hypothetical protein [Acinetobacter rudis]MDQ9016436.1 hypothetical protein [Acinetobacter rudis]
MSEAFIQRLVEFAESGNQQKIQLKGNIYQGWIMEISDQALLISTGFAEKTGKEIWIDFNDLQNAELSFWNTQTDQWTIFQL